MIRFSFAILYIIKIHTPIKAFVLYNAVGWLFKVLCKSTNQEPAHLFWSVKEYMEEALVYGFSKIARW